MTTDQNIGAMQSHGRVRKGELLRRLMGGTEVVRGEAVVAPTSTDLMLASEAATALFITVAQLRRMAARGEYPELLHVTRGHYLVRRADHESWMQGRWTRAELARADLATERVRAALLGKKA